MALRLLLMLLSCLKVFFGSFQKKLVIYRQIDVSWLAHSSDLHFFNFKFWSSCKAEVARRKIANHKCMKNFCDDFITTIISNMMARSCKICYQRSRIWYSLRQQEDLYSQCKRYFLVSISIETKCYTSGLDQNLLQ